MKRQYTNHRPIFLYWLAVILFSFDTFKKDQIFCRIYKTIKKMPQKMELVPLPVGAMLDGKYQVVKRLGEPSGFGIAYLCKDRNLDIDVVIKEFAPSSMAFRESGYVIQPDHEQKDAFLEFMSRFVDEAKLLAKVSETLLHPNIVRVLNAFQGNGTAYFVMSYLEGETFMQKMEREGRLEPISTMKRLLPILDALHQLHHYGKKGETTVILHRDLKPDNLFLTKRGLPVLIDFGLAKELEKSSDYMNYGLGAKGFGSPEQLNGRKVGRIGEWTDVYGIVGSLFHLVTGIPPNLDAADDFLEKRALHPKPEISAALKAMFTKGLAFSPKDRTQNIATLQAEWEAIIAPEAAPKPAPSLPAPRLTPAPVPVPPMSHPNVILPPQAGTTRFDELSGLTFVYCPKGDFIIGSKAVHKGWDDCPPTPKRITEGFWFAETPLTQAQFRRFIYETGYQTDAERNVGFSGTYVLENGKWGSQKGRNWRNIFVGDMRPVVGVSWNDAQKYLEWLNQKSKGKMQYKLPSEAQWEYACRAGTTTEYYFGDKPKNLEKYAWFCGNSKEIKSVKSRLPNAWGLYDMHGNVWEWCSDCYDKDYYANSQLNNPENELPQSCNRVLRGGSWDLNAYDLRSARRNNNLPVRRSNGISFRPIFIL
jgi:formylglycine-generating enzyme required for sulfatase activity/predicted Ser/Thr protein kinase